MKNLSKATVVRSEKSPPLHHLQHWLHAAMPPNARPHLGEQGDAATKTRERLKRPPMYRVLLLN
ncbi:MAG: hypothetical protein FJX22_04995, partial [Alphaproteobacteria bacterium]|nr:hypothetical protein [Alphaproteobacteria bacterium]